MISNFIKGTYFLVFLIAITSCNKENTLEKSELQFLEELGVNTKFEGLFAYKSDVNSTALKFNSFAEAKQFIYNSINYKNIGSKSDTILSQMSGKILLPDCERGNLYAESTGNYINGHFVSFEYTLYPGGSYGLNTVTSGLWGFHPGVSWSHLSSTSYTTVNGVIHYTINGIQHYNIIVEGVGTVFSQPVTITGYYQPCTGAGKITTVANIE